MTLRRCRTLLLIAAVAACAKSDPLKEAQQAFKAGKFEEALVLAQPLAEAGDPKAQVMVGLMFSQAKGAPEDFVTAAGWFRKAADQGYASAQFDLGYMYESGSGVPMDPAEAYKWYSLAAAQGDRDAAKNLQDLAAGLKKGQIAEGQKRAAAFKPTK